MPLTTRSHSCRAGAALQGEGRSGARDEQIDARAGDRRVGARQRDLLPDDRREVAVEGEQELLDLAALRVATGKADAVACC